MYPISPAEIEEKYITGAAIPTTVMNEDERYLSGIEVRHFIRDNNIVFDCEQQEQFYRDYLIFTFMNDTGFQQYIFDNIIENTNI